MVRILNDAYKKIILSDLREWYPNLTAKHPFFPKAPPDAAEEGVIYVDDVFLSVPIHPQAFALKKPSSFAEPFSIRCVRLAFGRT